jgi:hypothetical protein
MRILAARWSGLAGLIALLSTSTLFAQNQPFSGLGGADQARPEASLLPASGLTLDAPRELDLSRGSTEIQPQPSDGLGLQVYGSGSIVAPRPAAEGERLPDSHLPGH